MPIDLETAIRRRRMHRDFEDRKVSPEDLDKMLWAVSRAQQGRPGVRNVIVVDDPVLMKTARQVFPGFMDNNAQAMFILCSDLSVPAISSPAGREHLTRIDAGAACAHLGLMAQELGMGVCTITSWTHSAVRELFGIPGHLRPDVTVIMGYPTAKQKLGVKGSQYLPDIHHNEYGVPYKQEQNR
jgi:nitroreductase